MEQEGGQKRRKKQRTKGRVRIIIPYLLIIFSAAVLIIAVIMVTGRKAIRTDREPTVVEIEEASNGNESNTNRIEKNSDEAIRDLIQRYFQASKAADVEELSKITDQEFDEERLKLEAQYIESYQQFNYYVIQGLLENTYIVYVSYYTKFIGVPSPAPSILRFYVCKDSDGTATINMSGWSDEVSAYINEVAEWPEISELRKNVSNEMEELKQTDETFRNFVNMLESGGQFEEETESPEEISTEEESDNNTSTAEQ